MTGTSFRFRLERVRALRERSEDVAKEALAGALHQHRLSEQQLQAAEDSIVRARIAQLDATGRASSASDLLARQSYLERTEQAHLASRRNLRQHEIEVEKRREALTAAAREREALERLKQHRRADHEREAARQERLALDEIAITGYRRRAA